MTTTQKTLFGGLLAIALCLGQVSMAAEATAAKSVADQKSLLSEVLDRTSVQWTGELLGPAFSDFGSLQTDADGKNTGSSAGTPTAWLDIYHSAYVNYAIGEAKAYKIFVNPRFFASPFFGTQYVGDNLRIGIKNSSLVKAGDFNLYAKIDAKLPTTQSAVDKQLLIAPGFTVIGSVDIPKTRWSLETYVMGRANAYAPDKASDEKGALALGFAQNIIYRLSPTVATSFYTEYYVGSSMADATAFQPADSDLYNKLYVMWDVSKKINLTPYVRTFPLSEAGVLKTAALGLEFSATLY